MATTINAGRVRFVSRGTYNNSTQYYLFDLVDYNGSSYIAKENSLGNLPTNTQYWQLIAEKGNTGNTGQTGPVGATGNGIASITKTGTSGLVDTYTITYTNGNTTTFTVTNGEDGEVTQAQFDDLQQRVEDAENNQLTNTPTPATSHYLQDSADSRFRKFIPIGRTTQESTTGKNILPINLQSQTIKGLTITKNNDGSFTINGTSNAWTNLSLCSNQEIKIASGNSCVSRIETTGSKTGVLYFGVYNVNTKLNGIDLPINTANYTTTSYTASEDINITRANLEFASGVTFTNCTIKIWTEKGTAISDYESYTGGEPAPNPKYPFPIKNTGDNGSVNEKVQNKNLLASENINVKVAGVTYKSQEDGTILANGEKYGGAYANFTNNIVTLENDSYSSKIFLLDGTIKKDGVHQRPSCYLVNTEDSTKTYYIGEIGQLGKTQTIDAGTYYIRFAVWSDNILFTNAKIGLMLVKGSTIPDEFVPHEEQNISFPLAEGQKFYEGSHPDDDEKVHHKWGEVDLSTLDFFPVNRNENSRTQGLFATSFSLPNMFKYGYEDIPSILSNKYIAKRSLEYLSPGRNPTDMTVATYIGMIYIQNSDFSGFTNAQVKEALKGTIVQYPLAEEQTEDFTEEQKTAWEEWKKARTYKNVTHISSEDETPANVEIEYVRDLETVINNLSN